MCSPLYKSIKNSSYGGNHKSTCAKILNKHISEERIVTIVSSSGSVFSEGVSLQ